MRSSPEALNHRPQRWLKPAGLAGLGLAAIVVLFGLLSRGLAGQQLKTRTLADVNPTVQVIAPKSNGKGEALTLPGQVEADYDAVIHARVSGYLKAWNVDIGAQVKQGQVLAEIDTPELDQQLAQARAALATADANQKLAQITAARWANLLARDAVSHQEADEKAGDLEAKTAISQAAKAEVDRLQALETFKRIVAPFDGVVTARNTDIGALIAAGQPNDPGLFTVADVRRLRIYVRVPQSYSAEIAPGAMATLTAPEYPGQTFRAKLTSTSDAVGDQSGALLVELQMDNADNRLKPGEYVQARFNLPAAPNVLSVPASALMLRNTGMEVAVVGTDGKAHLRPITIQRDLGVTVEVSSGLGPNDRVIDNPPDSLTEGETVKIAAGSANAQGSGRQG